MKPRNYTEIQLEAQGMTNNITLISEETAEIEPKIEGARPDGAGTLGIMPQLEKGCRIRLKFKEIKLLQFLHVPCTRGSTTGNIATG